MKDSPAACATLGVNLLTTKVAVFALSAAIAGFGGAMLGMLRGSAATANFQVLQGLPYVILIVIGGSVFVSGALLGGFFLQFPLWLLDKLGPVPVTLPVLGRIQALLIWNRLSVGLLGFALGGQPHGIIPEVSSELEEKRRKRKQEADRAQPAADRPPPEREPSPPTPVATPGG